jgi:hypothetical protein
MRWAVHVEHVTEEKGIHSTDGEIWTEITCKAYAWMKK